MLGSGKGIELASDGGDPLISTTNGRLSETHNFHIIVEAVAIGGHIVIVYGGGISQHQILNALTVIGCGHNRFLP
jgi:hypothetical protein